MATLFAQDLAEIEEEDRIGHVAGCADEVQELLVDRFPASDGYRHTRLTTKPFQEWPQIRRHHLKVRRGWFWGLRVSLSPEDFQLRQVDVSLARDFAFSEAIAVFAVVVGFLSGIGGVAWVLMGTSDDYRDAVIGFFGGVALGVITYGLLWIFSRPIIKACADEIGLSEAEDEVGAAVRETLCA